MWWPKMISVWYRFLFESSQLWSGCCDTKTHNSLCMLRLRAPCVADGQHLTVSSLMSLFMYPCTLYRQWYVDQCCVWLSVFSLFTRYYSRLLLTYTFLMHCSGLYSSFVNSVWAVGLFQSCIEKHGDTGPCARVAHDFLLRGNAVNATILSVFNLPSAAIWLSVRNNLMFVPFLSSPRAKKAMSSQNPAWVPDWLY